jgi:hypothetical protein
MESYGFAAEKLNEDWDCIDNIRKRRRNFKIAHHFFGLYVIRHLWFSKNGFYKSIEMKSYERAL